MKEHIDNAICWIAHLLPRRLAYWCAIRVIAHASRVYVNKEMDALTPADCLKAWKK
jgi:hypothetical protein